MSRKRALTPWVPALLLAAGATGAMAKTTQDCKRENEECGRRCDARADAMRRGVEVTPGNLGSVGAFRASCMLQCQNAMMACLGRVISEGASRRADAKKSPGMSGALGTAAGIAGAAGDADTAQILGGAATLADPNAGLTDKVGGLLGMLGALDRQSQEQAAAEEERRLMEQVRRREAEIAERLRQLQKIEEEEERQRDQERKAAEFQAEKERLLGEMAGIASDTLRALEPAPIDLGGARPRTGQYFASEPDAPPSSTAAPAEPREGMDHRMPVDCNCAICGLLIPSCSSNILADHMLSAHPVIQSPQPTTALGAPKESDYFYDLQMRRTGPTSAPVAAPSRPAPPAPRPPTSVKVDQTMKDAGKPAAPSTGTAPAPTTADAGSSVPRESDYFGDLQTRKTGPPPPKLSTAPAPPEPKPCRPYTQYNTGVVEGTSWIAGFNRPPEKQTSSPREAYRRLCEQLVLAEKMEKNSCEKVVGDWLRIYDLKRQGKLEEAAKLQGNLVGTPFDPTDYDFLIGVGAAYDVTQDGILRVAGDEFTLGGTSSTQPLYASLGGREFERLDCHSNGAMVCLAALSGKCPDAKATNVRLFAPQITPAAARQWQRLLDTGRVRSAQLYINKGDPITPVSYAAAQAVTPGTLSQALAKATGGTVATSLALTTRGPRVVAEEIASWLSTYESVPEAIQRDARGIRIVYFDNCRERNLGLSNVAINAALAAKGATVQYDWEWNCHNWMRYQALVKGSLPARAGDDARR